MAHHGHGLTATASARVAFLGMPNTGKSTLFSAISGHHAHIGNWPGLTVDLMAATVTWNGRPVELVDLPGLYDLRGLSEDEAVVRRFLETTPLQMLVVVQLRLALQVKALGVPMVVALNMADEAGRFGVKVDCDRLARTLGVPVLPISAKHRRGLGALRQTMQEATGPDQPPFAPPRSVVECLPEEDGALPAALESVLRQTVELPGEWQDRLSRRLDRVLLHPWLGLPLFFLAMALMFQAVYAIGAPIQEQLTTALDGFGTGVLRPALGFLPDFWRNFLVGGLYQGIGTVTAFLPVIFLFFLAMGVVEDSGYLSRSDWMAAPSFCR
jgi:ferrous iron transport protein B